MMTAYACNSDFRVFGVFLRRFEVPAAGRAREGLTPEEKAKTEALARGELDEDERRDLAPLLSRNESALEYLASLIKGDTKDPRKDEGI